MNTVPERLAAALADRYRLEREIGAGGMATVYLAHDLKHDRPVALKVLRPELAAVLGAERFVAEIKTTARLQHPHILPLLDSGEAAGLLYYVMPYVAGETLRARLQRTTQLGVDETLRIARALAAALDYAHAQGVIHRDLKPENILFQADEPVLADFGIALAVNAAGGQRLTETGLSLGTPQYMSPEQAAGDRVLDARSDVYSLGAVVYELLAGEPPHTGPTVAAVVMKVMTLAAAPLSVVRPGLPADVEAAVLKALAKAPADRFASAGGLAAALEAGRASPSGADAQPRSPAPARFRGDKSVVVLPFVNAGGAADDFFSDGLTEELITDLARLEGVRVVSSAVSFRLKAASQTVPSIAAELGVRYAVLGRVRRAGDSVRITAQLVEAADEQPLWADRYTGTIDHLFDFQERVSSAIAGALKLQIAERRRVADPVASDLLRQARHHLRQYGEDYERRALGCCEEALARDPECAPALALQARILANIATGAFGGDVADYMPRARHAAERAIAIDRELADAHLALALVASYQWDFGPAVGAFQEALRIDPALTAARFWFGLTLLCIRLDAGDQVREQIRRALETDPLDAMIHVLQVHVENYCGTPAAAVAAGRRAVALFPRWGLANFVLGHALRNAGQLDAAVAAYQRAIEVDGAGLMFVGALGGAYAAAGREADALRCLAELEERERAGEPADVFLYLLSTALGDDERTFGYLERALARRAPALVWIANHPWQDRLRGHLRFLAALHAMGLDDLAPPG